MAKPRTYPSDLSDAEWFLLEPLLPPPSRIGRPRKWPQRHVTNAIFYVLRTGCAWRALPHDFPPWNTVYCTHRHWRRTGVWARANTVLRELLRVRGGRDPTPSAAIIDSQTSKTTEAGGPRGFDGAKKVNGRKRHVLVDSTGMLLRVVVHPADVQDREGGRLVLDGITAAFPRLEKVWADQGYTGALRRWAHEVAGVRLEVVYPWWRQLERYAPELLEEAAPKPGFNVLPRRWVVERTFAWLGRHRRLSKDYEALPATTEAWVYAAMTRLMLARLSAG